MAQVIVGVAIAAMCELFASGTQANLAATELTTAINLAGTIHEASIGPPGVGQGDRQRRLWAMNGQEYSPPLDAARGAIGELDGWAQRVRVSAVDPKDPAADAPDDPTAATVRLGVTVYHNGRYVYGTHWLVAADLP